MKKHQKGFTLIELILTINFIVIPGFWIWNAVKLTDCDFEPNYRCEIIHGAGLIPVVSILTVWFGTDAKE